MGIEYAIYTNYYIKFFFLTLSAVGFNYQSMQIESCSSGLGNLAVTMG